MSSSSSSSSSSATCIAGSLVTVFPSNSLPSVEQKLWGKVVDGTPIYKFTLRNASGMSVVCSNFGCAIVSIVTADKNGNFDDVVLGYDTAAQWVNGKSNFNSICGRYANRIAGAKFELDGHVYKLNANNGPNHLHGGPTGFYSRLFESKILVDSHYSGVEFRYRSVDGEEGYPGTLDVKCIYKLTAGNTLRMEWYAETSAPTVCNLCSHVYFNLSGHSKASPTNPLNILDHRLILSASHVTPIDDQLIPTGKIVSVKDPGFEHFDFTKEKTIGQDLKAFELSDPCTRGGIDHNFVIDKDPINAPQPSAEEKDASIGAKLKLKMSGNLLGKMLETGVDGVTLGQMFTARFTEPNSGRIMDVYTTAPGFQIYTGNWLDGTIIGKGAHAYQKHAGVCIETQTYPNSPNTPQFPSPVLRPGQQYVHITSHHFSVQHSA